MICVVESVFGNCWEREGMFGYDGYELMVV